MDEAPTLEALARQAVDGDRDAVASIVRELQANMHALALRMLWNPQDAEDATQEILVRVVTRLAQFDFKSRLRTWAYRVATNYLLDVKKSCVERQKPNFTSFAEDLAEGLHDEASVDVVDKVTDAVDRIVPRTVAILCLQDEVQVPLGGDAVAFVAQHPGGAGEHEGAIRGSVDDACSAVGSV